MNMLKRRFQWQTTLMLVMAVLTGTMAVLGTRAYVAHRLAGERPASPAKVEVRDVVVAKIDLAAGEILREPHMASRSIPSQYVSPHAVLVSQHEQLLGRMLVQPVAQSAHAAQKVFCYRHCY